MEISHPRNEHNQNKDQVHQMLHQCLNLKIKISKMKIGGTLDKSIFMTNILQISGVASAILFLSLIDKKYATTGLFYFLLEKVEYKIRDKMKPSILFQLKFEWKKCIILFLKPTI